MIYTEHYRVRWHDTDASREVHPSGVLLFMQETANRQFEAAGRPLDVIRDEEGVGFILSRIAIEMAEPIHAYEDICVETYTCPAKGYSFPRGFAIKRDGGFEYPEGSHKIRELAIPEHDFSDFDKQEHEYAKSEYTIVGAEYKFEGKANTYVFDERRFKIWEKNDGGDDFYHLYDPEKYAETDGYGPILYAYITERSRFIDRPFNRIEYNGNSSESLNAALSVGDYNYKVFIEGYKHLSTLGSVNDETYFCVSECPCHSTSVKTDWACVAVRDGEGKLIKCDRCHKDCRPCPPELVGFEGYQYYCNSDGLVPVTQELRDFLYAYCDALRNFNDGTGSWEKNPISGRYFQAVDESGWLFDCAYYEKK